MSKRSHSKRAILGKAAASIGLLSSVSAFASFDPLASTFTFGIIPDPQYYTVVQWKTDEYFDGEMNWIVANQTSKNIAFVFGMGDNVQDGNPYNTTASLQVGTTLSGNILGPESQGNPAQDSSGHPSITVVDPVNSDYEAEWKRASAAFGILDAANIPYYTVIGNHDYFHWDQKNFPSEFEKYFGPQRYASKSYFGGFSPAGTSTDSAVKAYAGLDTYSYFEAGGYKFLNIALQFQPDAGDMAWAQSIINANPGLPTIVSTHDYQNDTGRDASGNALWSGLINSNSQIFMVLSGHVNGTHEQISTDASGQPVAEILTDYQDDGFGKSQGFNENYANGGGFLRTLTFDLNANTITATSFSPYINSQGGNGTLTNYSGTGGNADSFTLNFNFEQRFGAPPLIIGDNFYWDPTHTHAGTGGGGSGTWDAAASSNWYESGTANTLWSSAGATDVAAFGGTGGTITISGNVTASHVTFMSGSYTATGGTLMLTGSAVIDTTSATGATINSVIGGTVGLFAKGGKLLLGGVNTFSGGITVDEGGTLTIAADSNLGASTNAVLLDGGTFSYTGGAAALTMTTRIFTAGANGATIFTPNAGTSPSNDKIVINHANGITGAGPITKSGPGWLTIYGGGNNATGNWTISGVVEDASATGLGSGGVTINNTGELAANTTSAIANPIVVNTGATIGSDNTSTVTSTLSGPITAAGNFNVRLGNFWSTLSQNVTLSGPINGSGAATIIAAAGTTTTTGKLTITGDNTFFTGGVTIPTGTLIVGASAGKPLGTGPVNLSGGKLALQGQALQTGAGSALGAVGVSGFNKDTIYAELDSPGTTTVGLDGTFGFFQDGYSPDELSLDGGQSLTPGIVSNNIVSAISNSVTHTQTSFTLASFTALNTLQIAHNSTGTLTLNEPGIYSNLAVLATSTFGADDTPVVTLHFADGTSVNTTFKAYDWSMGTDAARTSSDVFGTAGIARYSPTQSPGFDNRPFGIYESDIDLTNIGGVDYSSKQLVSLTFSAATGDGQTHAMTDVFAVSGSARAWVASTAGQSYANAVNVSANSSIDVSGVLAATMGALTINASKLSITSADATSNPYSLAFGNTTLNGAATFDVANSSGGGAGSLLLGVISGSGSITKSNSGTLKLKGAGSVISGGLTINAGTVEVDASTTVSTLSGNGTGTLNVVGTSLKLSGNSPAAASLAALSITSNGSLDLNANDLVIHYTTSPATTIRGYLVSGFNQGAWNGPGLDSLAAQIDSNEMTALGYAENSDLGLTTFDNGPVDAHTLIVKYTYYGDSNLDGKVDVSDFKLFLNGLVNGGSTWDQGDYTYDGQVDLGNDFLLFLQSYLRQGGSLGDLNTVVMNDAELSASQRAQLVSLVPEPGSLGIIGAAGVLALRRRRQGIPKTARTSAG